MLVHAPCELLGSLNMDPVLITALVALGAAHIAHLIEGGGQQ